MMTDEEFAAYRAERKRLDRFTDEERAGLQAAALKVVTEAYEAWHRHAVAVGKWGTPPRVTSSYVAAFLRQASASWYGYPERWEFRSRRNQDNLVASALRSLKKQGKLGTSLSCDEHGREIRCWEPAFK